MKGLWIKDLLTLKKQRNMFLIFMLITIFNGYVNQSVDIIFLLMSFFFVSVATTTIFYDQENKGLLYLFTLPTKGIKYVVQKELLILASVLISIIMSMIFVGIIVLSQNTLIIGSEKLIEISSSALLVGCLTGNVIIPLYLKFGSEQARVIMLILISLFIAGGVLTQQAGVIKWVSSSEILQVFENISTIHLAGISITAVLIVTIISTIISERIIRI